LQNDGKRIGAGERGKANLSWSVENYQPSERGEDQKAKKKIKPKSEDVGMAKETWCRGGEVAWEKQGENDGKRFQKEEPLARGLQHNRGRGGVKRFILGEKKAKEEGEGNIHAV